VIAGRRGYAAAVVSLLSLTLALAACNGSTSASPTPVPSPGASASVPAPTAESTPTALPRDLSSEIGVRADLPADDPIDLAARYRKTQGRAPAAKPFAGEPAPNSTRDFIVSRITSASVAGRTPPDVATVTATLLATSAHAYFYVDDALSPDLSSAQQAADDFEANVWPVVTGAFGEPATPGVDGDPRIIVLQADLGGAVGGYYTGDDAYLRSVRPLSNEAEMVYMDRNMRLGSATFSVVLAHELQHLIHAKNDRDEEVWINEGLSEDALMLAGGAASTINSFQQHPETQLNTWSNTSNQPHYGAAAAFLRYLADRFAGDLPPERMLGAIAIQDRDGAAGIDEFLASRGETVRFRDVFADWVAANVLNEDAGKYGNPTRKLDVNVATTLSPGDSIDGAAHQFGTDYYGLTDLGGEMVLRFAGASDASVLPASALADGPVLWSNGEDDIDTTLTYSADLASATSPALTFRAWYDIEPWYDWGYVSASTDGGATWAALAGDHTTANDPIRAAYGAGYNGTSGGGEEPAWVDERVDLSAYTGQKVLLRFEYVTDGAYHGAGMAIRDVALTGSSGDVGMSNTPESHGWITIDRPLPQTYAVRVIEKKSGGASAVLDVPVDASGAGELRFDTAGLDDAVVAVAGTTEGTDQLAPYTISLARP
jgi:hypothetical protein